MKSAVRGQGRRASLREAKPQPQAQESHFSRHSDGVCWPALLRARVLAFSSVLITGTACTLAFVPVPELTLLREKTRVWKSGRGAETRTRCVLGIYDVQSQLWPH